jgi:hypothetical protein
MAIITSHFPTTKEAIKREAPDAKGVFAIYSPEHVLIFYGFAVDSIRKQMLMHLKGEAGKCTREGYFFNFEITEYPIRRQKQLLLEYLREYRELPLCNNPAYKGEIYKTEGSGGSTNKEGR